MQPARPRPYLGHISAISRRRAAIDAPLARRAHCRRRRRLGQACRSRASCKPTLRAAPAAACAAAPRRHQAARVLQHVGERRDSRAARPPPSGPSSGANARAVRAVRRTCAPDRGTPAQLLAVLARGARRSGRAPGTTRRPMPAHRRTRGALRRRASASCAPAHAHRRRAADRLGTRARVERPRHTRTCWRSPRRATHPPASASSGTRAPPHLHEARHAAPPSRRATPGRLGRRREADAARRQRRAALRQHARRDRARSRLTRAQHPSAVPTTSSADSAR